MSQPTSFSLPIRVYIEDTDAGGIVYYVNYLKFMERARTEYMRSLSFGKNDIFSSDLMFVVHSLTSEYKLPAKLDDQLIATARVVKAGKANMVMEQMVFRQTSAGSRELLCQAEVKLACVDKISIKPKRMPAEMIEAIRQQLAVD